MTSKGSKKSNSNLINLLVQQNSDEGACPARRCNPPDRQAQALNLCVANEFSMSSSARLACIYNELRSGKDTKIIDMLECTCTRVLMRLTTCVLQITCVIF